MIKGMVETERFRSLERYGAESAYRPDIDGLRAVAVLSVLFFHARIPGFGGGFSGVDIFFVISGFLIGGHIYFEESSGRFSFPSFYRRRAKRILPALYAVILAVLVLGTILLSPLELRRAATEALAALGFASNVFFWKATNYFAVESSQRTLLMTWSLGVEEQFYLFVPLIIVWLMRRGIRLVPVLAVLAAISLGLAMYQVAHAPLGAFYLIPGRAWELLAGVLAALAIRGGDLRGAGVGTKAEAMALLGILFVAASILLLKEETPFPGLAAAPSVLGTALLMCTPAAAVNRKLLSAAPFRFIGRISYSLYLWHWPLLTLARIVLGRALRGAEAAAVLGIAFLCAWASFHWIERPFRGSKLPPGRLFARYAVLTFFLAAVCVNARLSYGWAWRAPALALQESQATPRPDPCLVESQSARPELGPPCLEDTGRPAVAIWGDSHAAALAPAVRDKAHAAGYDFLQLTKSSCPPLAGLRRRLAGNPGFGTRCMEFNADVLQRLRADVRVRIVLLAGDWTALFADERGGGLVPAGGEEHRAPNPALETQIFASGLERSTRDLQAAHKAVFILQDVPAFSLEPLWRVRTANLFVRNGLWRWSHSGSADPGVAAAAHPDQDRRIAALVARSSAVGSTHLLNPAEALCPSFPLCRYRDGRELWYEDQQHLTPLGASAALQDLHFEP